MTNLNKLVSEGAPQLFPAARRACRASLLQKYREGHHRRLAPARRASCSAPWWRAKAITKTQADCAVLRLPRDSADRQQRVYAARGHGEGRGDGCASSTGRSSGWARSWVFRSARRATCTSSTRRTENSARSFRRRTASRTRTISRRCISRPRRRCWRNSAIWARRKAKEVVIDNPGEDRRRESAKSACILKHPEGKETFQPFWPDAADNIRNLCEDQIREWFTATTLPEIVRGAQGKGAFLHSGLRLRHTVQHRGEAGQKIERGRLSGRLARQRSARPMWRIWSAYRRSTRCRRTIACPKCKCVIRSTWTRANTRSALTCRR